jgi:hypothetical protein
MNLAHKLIVVQKSFVWNGKALCEKCATQCHKVDNPKELVFASTCSWYQFFSKSMITNFTSTICNNKEEDDLEDVIIPAVLETLTVSEHVEDATEVITDVMVQQQSLDADVIEALFQVYASNKRIANAIMGTISEKMNLVNRILALQTASQYLHFLQQTYADLMLVSMLQWKMTRPMILYSNYSGT